MRENLLYLSGVDRDENWLRVSNSKGQIGLVPINYVDVDGQVSGGAVLDFLDESLQVARREKSRFLQELQEIRRSILNPVNDLECRLAEFHSLINHLKAKGSPFFNQIHEQEQLHHHQKQQQIKGSKSVTKINSNDYSHQSRTNGDDDEEDGATSAHNYPSSFMTCNDQQHHSQKSHNSNPARKGEAIRKNEFYQGDFSRGRGSSDFIPKNKIGHGSSASSSSSFRPKKAHSNTFIQYVDVIHDNESQVFKMSGDNCSPRSLNEYDNRSLSGSSTATFTCSKGKGRKVKQLQEQLENSFLEDANKTMKTIYPKKVTSSSPPSPSEAPRRKHFQNNCQLQTPTPRRKNLPETKPKDKKDKKRISSETMVEEDRPICELIEKVRQSTGISHEISQKAVQTVLQYLKDNSGSSSDECVSNINLYIRQLESPTLIHQSTSFIRSSADFERLYIILCELSAQAQDDELWEIQEFESTENLLEELNQILSGADKRIIVKALEEDDYRNVHCLALYYQKEHSWSSRKLLIQAFAKIASIDLKALSVLLNSVLPLELAREILDSTTTNEEDKRENRLETAGCLLGLLLSTGERLPVRHLEFLGKDFLNFILDKIDSSCSSSSDSSSELSNVLFNLILAYNLQFGSHDENLVIATLASRRNAKFLTQKIVHLLLWEQDPISVMMSQNQNHQYLTSNNNSKCVDSVLKLVLEMFSCSMIADLFYTNDTKVLIDIVVRSLTDWEPGEKKRTLYLQLIRMIIRNSNFRDHNHRRDDLVKIFTSILLEEDPLAITDHRLIREITNEFPTLLK